MSFLGCSQWSVIGPYPIYKRAILFEGSNRRSTIPSRAVAKTSYVEELEHRIFGLLRSANCISKFFDCVRVAIYR